MPDYSRLSNGEPTREEKDYLDKLHPEAQLALATQTVFEDDDELLREQKLIPMRQKY